MRQAPRDATGLSAEHLAGAPSMSMTLQENLPARVAMLGSMPPDRGISAYCLAQAQAVAALVPVTYIAFRQMYPRFLYPGGGLAPDHTFPRPESSRLEVRRRLAWYNPVSWLWEGWKTPGDLLHLQVWSLPVLPMCLVVVALFRWRRKPVVVTLHNVEVPQHALAYRWLAGWVLRRAQAVVVHTAHAAARAAVEFRLPTSRLFTLPHGVLDTYVDKTRDRVTARQSLGLAADDLVVLFFGAIRPHKGLETLLGAFAALRGPCPRAKLVVAGKPWEPWDRYQQLIERWGLADAVVTRLEYVPHHQVGWLFAAADVVALPYLQFDAQSGVALAALAWGRPLVATRVGGLPELIGDPRWLVPPGDAQALAGALAELLSDPGTLDKATEESRQRATSYQWKPIAEATVAIYRQVLSTSD